MDAAKKLAETLPPTFTIDVHTHIVPDIFREALIDSGAEVKNNQIIIDGYAQPDFTVESYLENREKYGYDYSVMSITGPGIGLLSGNPKAVKFARNVNNYLSELTGKYPDKLGAFAWLPLPNIEASLEELKYCLDDLHFDGVGLYTNYQGVYLGDKIFDPIFEELNKRGTTVMVHPVAPEPEVKLNFVPSPALEYPFDTTRAITNLVFTKTRTRYPNIKIIWSHGGGTLPFLAERIVGMANLVARNPMETLKELKGYYFDLATATSEPQLLGLKALLGSSQLLIGSDYPYFPAAFIPIMQRGLTSFKGFTEQDLKAIRHENALALFPRIVEKLSKLKK